MGWREVGSRAEAAQGPVPAPASRLSVPGALGGSARGSLDLALLYLPLIEEEEQRKSSNLIIFFLMNSACFCLVYFLDFRVRSWLKSFLYLFGCAGSLLPHAGSSSRNQRPPAWAAWGLSPWASRKDPPQYLCGCIHYFSHAEGQIGLSGLL